MPSEPLDPPASLSPELRGAFNAFVLLEKQLEVAYAAADHYEIFDDVNDETVEPREVAELYKSVSARIHESESPQDRTDRAEIVLCRLLAAMPARNKARLAEALDVDQTTLGRWLKPRRGYRGPPRPKAKNVRMERNRMWWEHAVGLVNAALFLFFDAGELESRIRAELPDKPVAQAFVAPIVGAIRALEDQAATRFAEAVIGLAEGKQADEVTAEMFPEVDRLRKAARDLLDDPANRRLIRAVVERFPQVLRSQNEMWARSFVDSRLNLLEVMTFAMRKSPKVPKEATEKFEARLAELTEKRDQAIEAWALALAEYGTWPQEWRRLLLPFHPLLSLLVKDAKVSAETVELMPLLEDAGIIGRGLEAEHDQIMKAIGEAHARLAAYEKRQQELGK